MPSLRCCTPPSGVDAFSEAICVIKDQSIDLTVKSASLLSLSLSRSLVGLALSERPTDPPILPPLHQAPNASRTTAKPPAPTWAGRVEPFGMGITTLLRLALWWGRWCSFGLCSLLLGGCRVSPSCFSPDP